MFPMELPLLFSLALSLLLLSSPVYCNIEGDALISQKNAWSDPSDVLVSWDSTLVNPCTWFHVTCNNDNFVVRLDLGYAGLSGPLVPELGLLENLQYLQLYGNNISGRIPPELGNLKHLVSIHLDNNRLIGGIPSTFANLLSLRYLRLDGNMLSGRVQVDVLGNLIFNGRLSLMNISDNNFKGTIKGRQGRGLAITNIIQDPKSI